MAEEITVWWATKIEKQILDHRMRIEKLEKNPIIRGHKHDEVGRIVWVVGDGPFPEKSKPRTCGECRHPWRKATWKNVDNLACFNQRSEVKWVGENQKACDDFEPREESCT
jgi:hypothetical protein